MALKKKADLLKFRVGKSCLKNKAKERNICFLIEICIKQTLETWGWTLAPGRDRVVAERSELRHLENVGMM